MSYKALYNKYRSQTFDELVGQESVITTLKNALATKKIAHAYLFSGPRGTGKTSVARLFAKALNCSDGIGHQCNDCDNCKQITEGSHPDVIEIDAASNSGVDEVRSLIEKVKYAPIKGRYKIYIIDEVHMMTSSAFNALLKTLEEPPEYVIFILCTTEPYKLLPTILSRCQRFEFSKINDDTLKVLINRTLTSENVKADEETVNLLVELANGGARDALSILDQLIAYSGELITVKDIESVFGLASVDEKIELLTYVSTKDTLSLLKFYEKLLTRNIDIQRLNSELLNVLKDSLIYKKINSTILLKSINEDEAKKICSLFHEKKLITMIEQLLSCQSEFKTTNNPNFLFEIYLLKLLEDPQANPIGFEQTSVKDLEPRHDQSKVTIPQEPINFSATNKIEVMNKPLPQPKKEEVIAPIIANEKDLDKLAPVFLDDSQKDKLEEKSPIATSGESYNVDQDTLVKIMVTGNKKAKEEIVKRWNLLDLFKNDKNKGPFAMLLKDGLPYIVTPNIILVSFNFEKEALKCNIKENQENLQKVMEKIVGKRVFIYGINRKVLNDITHEYLNLKQVNKLPKAEDIGEIKIDK